MEIENEAEREFKEDFLNRDHMMSPVRQFRLYKSLLEPYKEKKVTKPKTSSQTESTPEVPKKLGTKTDYVPPWWKGEKGAYESAKKAMSGINNLPKMSR